MKKIISILLISIVLAGLAAPAVCAAPASSAQIDEYGGYDKDNAPFEYFSDASGIWKGLFAQFWKTRSTGSISYCLESGQDPPSSESYHELDSRAVYSTQTLNGIKAILLHGYPSDTGGLSDDEAHYATQVALWTWMYESAGAGSPVYESGHVRVISGYEVIYRYYQKLLGYARSNNQNVAFGISASPSTVLLDSMNGKFQGYTTVVFSNLNGNFTIDQSKIPAGVTITPASGRDGAVLTITSDSAFDGKTIQMANILVGHDTRVPANVFWYEPDDSNYQNMVVFDMNYQPVARSDISFRVNAGNLSIVKTTQNNGGTVSGFSFEVKNSAGTLVGTYTTTVSGKIDIPNLQPGVYSVKEVNLSSDFVAPIPNPKNVTVIAGQTATVNFDNVKKLGVITIKKSDANPAMGGYSLAGAVFEVKNSGGALVDTITTGADGKAQSKALPLGTYQITEKTAPRGFVRDSKTYTSTLSGTQGSEAIVYAPDIAVAEQPQIGKINIVKSNSTPALGGYDLTGAAFEIRDSGGAVIETLVTDAQGTGRFRIPRPF